MYVVSLVHKYQTSLFKGDWSNGIFLEGSVIVDNQKDLDEIIERFKNKGEIELHEATHKYRSTEVSSEKTLLEFCNTNIDNNFNKRRYKRKHDGKTYRYLSEKSGYKFYYWLRITDTKTDVFSQRWF